jgi:membrane associated rhomboid family serine protease
MSSLLNYRLTSLSSNLLKCRENNVSLKSILVIRNEVKIDALSKLVSDILKAPMVIQACIAVNIGVFVAWYLFPQNMNKHFVNSQENFKAKRYWTMFTSSISHSNCIHLFMSLQAFVQLGTVAYIEHGMFGFSLIYVGSALCSSLVSLFCQHIDIKYFPDRKRLVHFPSIPQDRGGHGLSGVTSGLLVPFISSKIRQERFGFRTRFRSIFYPHNTLLTPSEYLSLCVFYDTIGALVDLFVCRIPIGFTAHLGGYLGGFLTLSCLDFTGLAAKPTPCPQLQKRSKI